MGSVWGESLKISIFGESHGEGIGAVLDGLPCGESLDMEAVALEMSRRAPGRDEFSTPRSERDAVNIMSGVFNGKTTGAPLCALIYNENIRSGDYPPLTLRPGHADLTAFIKYKGFSDYRGGGHFSGRLTAPLVFAGAVAKQILLRRNIEIYGHIVNIAGVSSEPFDSYIPGVLKNISLKKPLAVSDDRVVEKMSEAILSAKAEQDSVGGIIEAVAFGLPAGLGEPFFNSMESVISSMLFSIPAIKGVEFGTGFEFAKMRGSEANDPIFARDREFATLTNNNGGINGGITNGMPLIVRAAIKPTPSIARTQRTVDPITMEEVELQIKGRHDPCIVPRAVPVIEAAVALCVLDRLLKGNLL